MWAPCMILSHCTFSFFIHVLFYHWVIILVWCVWFDFQFDFYLTWCTFQILTNIKNNTCVFFVHFSKHSIFYFYTNQYYSHTCLQSILPTYHLFLHTFFNKGTMNDHNNYCVCLYWSPLVMIQLFSPENTTL